MRLNRLHYMALSIVGVVVLLLFPVAIANPYYIHLLETIMIYAILLFGLAQSPQIHGFLILCVGGIAAGTAFAQVMLRLQYFTGRFVLSMFLVFIAALVICGVAQLYSWSLPVPQASPDVMYKPPISGG